MKFLLSAVILCAVFTKIHATCTLGRSIKCESFLDLTEYRGNDQWETLTIGNHLRSVPNETLDSPNLLRNFPNLQDLTIVSKLQEIKNGAFSGLNNLLALKLYNNSIKGVSFKDLASLEQLRRVDFQHNNIEYISAPADSSHYRLNTINLSHNKLRSLESRSFTKKGLKKIILTHNKLSALTDAPIFSQDLVYLNLDSNELYYVDETVFDLPHLRELILSNNEFTILTSNFVLPNLERFDLSHNKLSVVGEGVFGGTPDLTHLYFNDNQLTELPIKIFGDKWPKVNVTSLYLHNNHLKNLEFLAENEWLSFWEISIAQNPWTCNCLENIFKIINVRGIRQSWCDEEFYFKNNDRIPVCVALESDLNDGECYLGRYTSDEAQKDFFDAIKDYRCTT